MNPSRLFQGMSRAATSSLLTMGMIPPTKSEVRVSETYDGNDLAPTTNSSGFWEMDAISLQTRGFLAPSRAPVQAYTYEKSYPVRTLTQDQALFLIPAIALMSSRNGLDVKRVRQGILVLSPQSYFRHVLVPVDWVKITNLLTSPEIQSALLAAKSENDVLLAFQNILESGIIALYP